MRKMEMIGGAKKLVEECTRAKEAAANDPMVHNIAEFAIDLNPKAVITGFPPQDRGVYGTCHNGFGPNTGWGGNIKASKHFDSRSMRQRSS